MYFYLSFIMLSTSQKNVYTKVKLINYKIILKIFYQIAYDAK